MLKKNFSFYIILLCFCILSTSVFAQIKQTDLYGSWVATGITYLNGEVLPDENILKYTYVKYSFGPPNKLFHSSVYHNLGTELLFSLVGDRIKFQNIQGFEMNVVKVLQLDKNTMIIIQAANHGLTDPKAIKYTLTKEQVLQDAMPLKNSDIFRIVGTDTLYQSGQKVYAQYTGPDFRNYISSDIEKRGISPKSGELLASFIVNKDGLADSLKILQGINPVYDKAYKELFNSVRKKWIPAHLNGKKVSVLMQQRMKYLTIDEAMPSYFDGNKANAAYNNQDYETALQYYNLALGNRPDEKDHLYKRGICKQKLGNLEGACDDWRKVKALGGNEADAMLEKFCNK
jgi:tetratricopeptide (TPR) repeat protein